jgi:hypothetical protein
VKNRFQSLPFKFNLQRYTASLRTSDAESNGGGNRGGLVNSLGRKVWVQSKSGRMVEAAPGAVLPFVGNEKPPPANDVKRNGSGSGSGPSPRVAAAAASREPAYLLVEVLEMEYGGALHVESS